MFWRCTSAMHNKFVDWDINVGRLLMDEEVMDITVLCKRSIELCGKLKNL